MSQQKNNKAENDAKKKATHFRTQRKRWWWCDRFPGGTLPWLEWNLRVPSVGVAPVSKGKGTSFSSLPPSPSPRPSTLTEFAEVRHRTVVLKDFGRTRKDSKLRQ